MKYFKVLCDLIMLKFIQSKIDKIKETLTKKFQTNYQEIFNDDKKWKYSEIIKNNFMNIFNEESNMNPFTNTNNFVFTNDSPELFSKSKEAMSGSSKKNNNSNPHIQGDVQNSDKFMSFCAIPRESTPFDAKASPCFKPTEDPLKTNFNLTKSVWPKSKTLLTIISKMFSECYICRMWEPWRPSEVVH